MAKIRILFLNLATFHFTGGIERVNRCIYKALDEESETNAELDYRVISVYDCNNEFQDRYANLNKVLNFKNSKIKASIASVYYAFFSDTILISHINLAIIAYVIKKLFPKKRIIIMAHGIEIWGDLSIIQKSLLSIADRIIAVSNFTMAKIVENHQINVNKVVVCNNGLDPFMVIPSSFEKPIELLKRYKIDINDSVLFTLSRLSSTELYKGYDIVLEALSDVVKVKPNVKYLIGGKGDDIEIERVMSLIKKYQLENHVQLLGFIKEEELAQHFLLADTYIMPSKNEGFGLVFIEAAFYGLNVIAGNMDGSRDAVLFHQGGNLVNPYNAEEIAGLILNSGIKNNQKQINKSAISRFEFPVFSKRFLGYIN
jgi:phosphatidylinositol alpha-1,6-mannosyltransferase